MTLPHVLSSSLQLPLHTAEHARHATVTARCISRVEFFTVPAIRDVNPLVLRNRMWGDGARGCDAVFPFLLHLSVHDLCKTSAGASSLQNSRQDAEDVR